MPDDNPVSTSDGGSRTKGPGRLAIALAIVALLLAAVVGGLIATAFRNDDSSNAGSVCDAKNVANESLPSVVTINVQSPSGAGSGSGEVIRADGYILTNNHVISSAANGGTVDVVTNDGTTKPAQIVGRDSATDLAVLKIDDAGSLPVIPFGSSSALHVGEPVVALGAPLGLSGTVTTGIVSARDRSVRVPADAGRTALLVSAIQTDASINPGNSGGALVDCDGNLVGVPTAGATAPDTRGGSSSGSIGIGFAIPSDFATAIADEIITSGRANHSFFGLEVATLPASTAARHGVDQGLFVTGVTAGSPAANAGIEVGDVITGLEGNPAMSADDLQGLTLTKRAGDVVEVKIVRDGNEHTVAVTLAAQPSF